MATDFVVMVPESPANLSAAADAIEMVDKIESDLTIYDPQSEISRLNQFAAEREVGLSSSSFELIKRSQLWSERTDGAFDVTAGALVDVWGFTQRKGQKPDKARIQQALANVGYQSLQLFPSRSAIRYLDRGMSINLGAIGKGYALDKMAAALKSRGVSDFLIHGGNSSVVASGDQSPGSKLGWAVGVAHPTKPVNRLAGLWLRDAAIGTSGSGKQFFHHQGRRYGHVIDPRTGYPAGEFLSLSVIASSATDADAIATGLYVMGVDATKRFFALDWINAAIMVTAGEKQDAVEVATLGDLDWVDPPMTPGSRVPDI